MSQPGDPAGMALLPRKGATMSTMDSISVGCGQITWQGPEWAGAEDLVLEQIAQAGYLGAPASPGTLSAEATVARYATLGMRPAPGYYSADFWLPEKQAEILEQVAAFAKFTHAIGLTEMYVATGGWTYMTARGKTRNQLAGQITAADGLTDAEMNQFANTLSAACKIALNDGVRCCFHNHVGTVIETRAELERLLALIDPDLLFLGPDTGHFAWAGDDPVAFCHDYAARIKTLHVKDINPAVAAEGRSQGWDYATFSRHGIWTEVGQGNIDFMAIFADLRAAGFAGWAIVETDVTQLATPLASAQISREYLKSIGI
jgi:inosose dehydratase